MRGMRICIALAAIALAGSANADVYVGGGTDFIDSTTPFTDVITVPDTFEVASIRVELVDFAHTWAGDVAVSLEAPNGASVDLVNRIGVFGGSGFGSPANYGGTYWFYDGAIGDLWATAGPLGDSDTIPGGDYFATTVEGNVSTMNSLAGQSAAGDWTLRITDSAGGDSGSLGKWKLDLKAVPAPGALALIGIAGLCGRRRRR